MRLLLLLVFVLPAAVYSQLPKIEPGVSEDLAKWRAVQYSNISYKLNLTLEKMSPVLKGSIEIHVTQAASACAAPNCPPLYLVLDWRKLPGHEKDSTLGNVKLNGTEARVTPLGVSSPQQETPKGVTLAFEGNDHLIFHDGVRMGENVITLDFTSPILTSGSAITRYIDKEDGSEYLYSLFVPSDASTAFPVFDQPDLKAKFTLKIALDGSDDHYEDRTVISNTQGKSGYDSEWDTFYFPETKPISTYVFAFAVGPWQATSDYKILGPVSYAGTGGGNPSVSAGAQRSREPASRTLPNGQVSASTADLSTHVYVRKSQAAKFQPHAAETFRLTREAIKYLETYFDYKFPWPKYDLVLIPEFPFGGMEHAGATFLKESSVIFPTEPTRGDEISRANVIFHETAHQWFGDLVTMRWFDDLWLKEGFAEFMAYKTLEHVMPDANAWKVFYERNKQAAYATDSTRGTTPIYQPIANLSAAKSAYGNIVYRKAPSFLRQAEFYLGEDKFQTAVRAFLKKHEYANAGWEDLVGEFEAASGQKLQEWGKQWVIQRGLPTFRTVFSGGRSYCITQKSNLDPSASWTSSYRVYGGYPKGGGLPLPVLIQAFNGNDPRLNPKAVVISNNGIVWDLCVDTADGSGFAYIFPNYGDYGYGIFLLDDKSRDYVLKHIGEEKDPFLRSMMWGALWDSVREAELDPREYVELVIRQLGGQPHQRGSQVAEARASARAIANLGTSETDETTIQSLLGRVSVALNYYLPGSDTALPHGRASATDDLRSQFEAILLDRMQHAETPGLRVTFYRAFVTNATTEHGRDVLKAMLKQSEPPAVAGGLTPRSTAGATNSKSNKVQPPATAGGTDTRATPTLRTKDRFDIVTRLIVLGDPDAPKLLADLEKAETSDDAKRYAYAAHAAFATAENRAKFWNDFISNKDISESWIEAAIGPFNSIRHPELSRPYLARALAELPNLKRTRKIFFINNWLAAWLGGQRDQAALDIVNKFLADNPNLDNDLRLKVLENVDVIERAVKIRNKLNKE
jgi:aminopeptidase N